MRNGLLIDWNTAAAMLAAVNRELSDDEKSLLSMLGYKDEVP